MNIIEYVPLAVRTEKVLPTMDRLVHGCMGLITEIGEVTTELKRMAIYEKELDAKRKEHILEEIGDVMWYVAIMLDALRVDVSYVAAAPKMPLPKGESGKWEALALMLGVHCGHVCEITQYFIVSEEIPEDALPEFLASLTMIISGMYVSAIFCDSSIEQAMENNIAKLRIRFPASYSNQEAEGRADKAGADARNS
jgi:NTP pyrophosphatase (non-canonical NTP hydrolase)